MDDDMPLCQFGPGGDFVRTWPANCRPLPGVSEPLEGASPDEPVPLVALGPAGIGEALAAARRRRLSDVLTSRSAALEALAMPAALVARALAVVAEAADAAGPTSGQESDHEQGTYRHTKAVGDRADHPRLAAPARLFPTIRYRTSR